MKAVVKYADGLVQFIQVPSFEINDGFDVLLPYSIEVTRSERGTVLVFLNRILGNEWSEVPEYAEEQTHLSFLPVSLSNKC